MEAALCIARQQLRSELYQLELVMRECYIDMHLTNPANNPRHKEYLNACENRINILKMETNKQIDAIEEQYLKEKELQ